MNKEIPTVYHSDYNIVNTFETRSLNENIPLVKENIPDISKKTKIFYAIVSFLLLSFFINGFIYFDIYRQIYYLQGSINVIQKEQIHRTANVYNVDRKRLLKSDFERWLADFKKLNDGINVPKI